MAKIHRRRTQYPQWIPQRWDNRPGAFVREATQDPSIRSGRADTIDDPPASAPDESDTKDWAQQNAANREDPPSKEGETSGNRVEAEDTGSQDTTPTPNAVTMEADRDPDGAHNGIDAPSTHLVDMNEFNVFGWAAQNPSDAGREPNTAISGSRRQINPTVDVQKVHDALIEVHRFLWKESSDRKESIPSGSSENSKGS